MVIKTPPGTLDPTAPSKTLLSMNGSQIVIVKGKDKNEEHVEGKDENELP